jgi:predicted transcriptional regulator
MPSGEDSMLASVGNRLAGKMKDLGVVQDASATILELGAALDAQLLKEQRPSERMRMLRETTNRIVRTANDAAQAYSRASRAITAELERPNTNPAPAQAMRLRLDAARLAVMSALDVASRRYPSLEEASPDETKDTPDA